MSNYDGDEYPWERSERLRREAEDRFERLVSQAIQAIMEFQSPHETVYISLNNRDLRSKIGLTMGWNPLHCPTDIGDRREDLPFLTAIMRLVASDQLGIPGLGYAAKLADFRQALSQMTALWTSVYPPKAVVLV